MSNQRLAVTDPEPGRDKRIRGSQKGARAALAGTLVVGLALSGAITASADIGGGGVGGGGGSGGIASGYWLYSGDDVSVSGVPMQGWGGSSIDYFNAVIESQARWADGVGGDRTGLNTACNAAIQQSIDRSPGATRARVVQVGVAVGEIGGQPYAGWGGSHSAMTSWYQAQSDAGAWQPYMVGHTPASLSAIHTTFKANIAASNPRIVCVALNDLEQVPPADYALTLATDKSTAFTVAGSTADMTDKITASANGSTIRENINAVVTLHWGGVENNAKSAQKTVSIKNEGETTTPAFKPSDFGWTSWPSGDFWFDVAVTKQSKMKAAAKHDGKTDPRESWSAATTPPRKVLTSGSPSDALGNNEVLASGMFYNAEISARTNGYASSMTITDTIGTDKVWIGTATADDASKAYVLDPSGNKVAGASIEIDRSGGKVTVSGTVTGISDAFQAREYKLVVPTFVLPTKADYTITDDSDVCYTAAKINCIDGNNEQTRKVTPAPDKVWVLDENGALAEADPGHSNQEGVDNKVFAPGSGIGAVVNGSIPANLAENLSSYSITDDWSGAAKYIDFSDASKVKVFLNGANVTSQFDITISGNKTTATAKAAFLGNTKGLAQARSVKLFIGGAFKKDYETDGKLAKLTNSGSEKWNNETVDANTPAIYTATADPDKVWVLDENGALGAFDPNETNNAGADNKTFAPGSTIGAVVNGSIPANLGAKLTEYSLTDDWTGAARYIDFSNAGKAKVFLDGVNVTNQFDITVVGTKTVATAKAAFLNATVGRATGGVVKLFIEGSFRNTYDTDGALERLTNAGAESWNGKSIETNTPAIYTVTPDPDKVWVLDENGALGTADPNHSNTVGVDNKTFAPGSAISAVVNGSIPRNLGSKLNSYEIADDWSGAAKYIDFSDASRAKVFLDGVNVTNQFDVTVSGTRTIATAKAAFLNNTLNRGTEGTVKLYVAGAFKKDYDTDGKKQSLTNAGWEKWNNKQVATNTPAIFTVTPDPDKAWVLDENGALTVNDPNHSNNVGSDNKTFAPGASISAVVNGSVPADLGRALDSYVITDDWTGAAKYVDFSDASKVKVFLDGVNVTSQFDINVLGSKTTATAKASFLGGTVSRATEGKVKLFISGQFRNNYDTMGALDRLTNAGSESWNGKSVEANTPAIFTITPTPDKVWVLDENGGLSTSDKDWSNTDGSDNKVFFMNDAVAAVVNGSIPANLGAPLYNYSLTDDWSGAADYVDFSDASKAKVFLNGADVTSQFDVKVVGTSTVATAKAEFLAATVGLAETATVKLIISGFFRDDYDTNGQIVKLTNGGSETWNNRTQVTNDPPVYTWTPDPNKQVIGSTEESGNNGHSDIDGSSVWPGQKLEYSVGVDLRIPGNTARGIKSLAIEDVYDPYFTPDKSSVEFWDSRNPANPRPIARSAYKLVFNEAEHKFTATFTQAWIDANVGEDGANSQWLSNGWLTMRFTGTVSKSVPGGSTVINQAFQVINGARTATEIPAVEIPTVTPDKEDLSTDLIDIDGKTVVEGDVILYRLLLDGGPDSSKLAYNVHKLGMVDDYDEKFLKLDESDITVTEKDTGLDVTGKFNVQVKDGIAYVFAKTVDSEDAYGETIAGDPQAADLKAYDEATIKPLEDAIIDQALLGQNYWITLRTTVIKEEDGYVIENQARQNIQNTHHVTKIVSNPLKDIDPKKDVVVSEETKGDSINEAEVKMNTAFNYRLDSSEIPANRAYKAKQWSLSDSFDRVHDQYTGIWAIYTNTDVYEGQNLVFKKGDLLADSAGHESEPWNDLFAVTFDEATYTFKAEATQKYLDLVETRPDLANAFSVYTKMIRIAPSEKVTNKVTESYNNFIRDSNEVWTFTNENPAVSVEKFTLAEGPEAGDRDDVRLAYDITAEQMESGVEVGIRVTNSGDVPLMNVSITDVRHDKLFGDVQGLSCLVPADPTAPGVIKDGVLQAPDEDGMQWVLPTAVTELAVGEVIECKGTLREMAPGMIHGDTAAVSGESIFSQKKVTAEDPWFAKAPSLPGVSIVKFTLDEGTDKGDRDAFKDALVLTPEQGKKGVKVGFQISNNGDEPLADVSFKDVTHDATTGQVEGVVWLDLVTEEKPAAAGATIVKVGDKSYVERKLSEFNALAVGETVLLVGTLTGVEAGTGHADLASVTGVAVYSGSTVNAQDSWNAKLPSVAVPTPPCKCEFPEAKPPVVPPVGLPPKGAIAGDPLAQSGANLWLIGGAGLLLLTAVGAAYGIRRRKLAGDTVSEADTDSTSSEQ